MEDDSVFGVPVTLLLSTIGERKIVDEKSTIIYSTHNKKIEDVISDFQEYARLYQNYESNYIENSSCTSIVFVKKRLENDYEYFDRYYNHIRFNVRG